MKLFSLAEIEKAIAEAEQLNKGEVLPVIASASASYFFVSYAYAWIFLILSTVLWFVYEYFFWGDYDILRLLILQLTASSIGILFSFWNPALRLVLSRKTMALEVHRAALAAFTKYGLSNTQEKTGILIYVSILERRVEIIADEGIYKKVGKTFWQEEVENIVQGIKKGNPNKVLIQEIYKMGEKLREHFPQRGKNINEVGNSPKILS